MRWCVCSNGIGGDQVLAHSSGAAGPPASLQPRAYLELQLSAGRQLHLCAPKVALSPGHACALVHLRAGRQAWAGGQAAPAQRLGAAACLQGASSRQRASWRRHARPACAPSSCPARGGCPPGAAPRHTPPPAASGTARARRRRRGRAAPARALRHARPCAAAPQAGRLPGAVPRAGRGAGAWQHPAAGRSTAGLQLRGAKQCGQVVEQAATRSGGGGGGSRRAARQALLRCEADCQHVPDSLSGPHLLLQQPGRRDPRGLPLGWPAWPASTLCCCSSDPCTGW